MQSNQLFHSIPFWVVFLGTLCFVILAIEIGFKLGVKRWNRSHAEKTGPLSSMVEAVLALLALLLAFTFNFAANKFEDRKILVVEEANTIQTVFLRSSLISQENKNVVGKLLREYVTIRLNAAYTNNVDSALERSLIIHKELWKLVEAANQKSPQNVSSEIFSESVNELIKTHARRLQIVKRGQIPDLVWIELYFVTFMSLVLMGYYSGSTHTQRSLAAPIVAITFATVLLLIADIDRPLERILQVSQQPMELVLQFIESETKF